MNSFVLFSFLMVIFCVIYFDGSAHASKGNKKIQSPSSSNGNSKTARDARSAQDKLEKVIKKISKKSTNNKNAKKSKKQRRSSDSNSDSSSKSQTSALARSRLDKQEPDDVMLAVMMERGTNIDKWLKKRPATVQWLQDMIDDKDYSFTITLGDIPDSFTSDYLDLTNKNKRRRRK